MLFLLVTTAICPSARCQSREQLRLEQAVDYSQEFRGAWRTIIGGRQDEIRSPDLLNIVTKLEASAAGRNKSLAEAARTWAQNFRKWVEGAKDGVVQRASAYEQQEEFTFGDGAFWKKNIHRNGYDPGLQGSGVEQLLRANGVLVLRQTLVGFTEEFHISNDDPSLPTLPTYALMAVNCMQQRAFLKREGKKEANRPGVWIYQGETPALLGAYYPAWYGVVPTLMVLRETEPTGSTDAQRYTISMRDPSGGVLQEMDVVERRGRPWSIRKRIYLPFSTIVYNDSRARVIEWRPDHTEVPSFSDIASSPVEAKHVIDRRYRNFLIPIEVAKQGEAAIRRYIGLDRVEAGRDATVEGREVVQPRGATAVNTDEPVGKEITEPERGREVDWRPGGRWLAIAGLVVGVIVVFALHTRSRRSKR